MKPYLVDVPVRVNIWIRPECQRKQFEVLKQACPSIIFLQSDGGRNDAEWESIRKNREIFESEVDWECKIFKIYEDHNLGLYAMGEKATSFIWEHVDRCIFLEDDYVPSVSFFRYCAELLEKYKDDLRIDCICGMNHLGKSEDVTADYFFSRQGSIWGTATWKRAVEMRDKEFSYGNDPYAMKLIKQRTRHNPTFFRRVDAYIKQQYYEGHVAASEYYHELAMYGQNQLQIIPKLNMISNIGATADSAHADSLDNLPKGIRRVFNMQTYEMEFPMKHPLCVMPDVYYEKKRNRIMGYNVSKLITTYRWLEQVFYKTIRGDLTYGFRRLKSRARARKNVKLEP